MRRETIGVMSESPLIFDRMLLRARRRRAAALGPATFLLDRVADDLADRLAAVLRRFDLALDLGTPGDAVRTALRASARSALVVGADTVLEGEGSGRIAVVADEEALPFRDAVVRSRGLGAVAAVRQRSARHAGANPPRAQAGRLVSRRADRRRHPDRAAASLRRRRKRDRGRRLAARRAVRRSARSRRAVAARRLRAAGRPTSTASRCATIRRSP